MSKMFSLKKSQRLLLPFIFSRAYKIGKIYNTVLSRFIARLVISGVRYPEKGKEQEQTRKEIKIKRHYLL